ncbi:hypothetical protein KGA66_28750 [Actinocrinis puniceicyclus]|uniref:Uncharacterized protein n=1 Tax=Actinocrinis puniceicyclus TaxID=977794 RepID=A0A8J8BE93_9ACTN|nr:hypothetical protein [Actinocrinis puniceicyclus]MBS2967057.1 hypothetical protein [Actinocrinis puniceicyclus]
MELNLYLRSLVGLPISLDQLRTMVDVEEAAGYFLSDWQGVTFRFFADTSLDMVLGPLISWFDVGTIVTETEKEFDLRLELRIHEIREPTEMPAIAILGSYCDHLSLGFARLGISYEFVATVQGALCRYYCNAPITGSGFLVYP